MSDTVIPPMRRRLALLLATVLLAALAACSDDDGTVAAGDDATEPAGEQSPTGSAQADEPTCPDRGPVDPNDGAVDLDESVVVTDGVHDDMAFCLIVHESSIGRCLGLVGEAAPEGEQLGGGTCGLDAGFGWSLHGVDLDSLLVIGFAPPDATHVRLLEGDREVDITDLVPVEGDDLVYFVAPIPADFSPETGIAMRDDEVLASEDMLRGCTSEALVDEDGRTYGRSVEHDCQFVDDDGNVLPDQ